MDGVRYVATALLLAFIAANASGQPRTAPQLARAAWDALNAGRLAEAAATFDEARKLAPREPSLLLGSALVARLQSRMDDARRYLTDALAIDPALTPASLLLGEVLYRAGDLDGAIGVYEQALALTPESAQLKTRLEAWRKEAALHNRFGQKLGDHFTVLFEGPAEAALAERAVAMLEAAYWRIGTALYTYPTGVITVVLYTREQFRDITQSPEWAGGAFDGRIRVPVQGALQNPREFERVLAHEFTHALVRSLAPRGVPVWLNEGLAVRFEGSDFSQELDVVRRAPAPLPLSRLEKPFDGMSAADARLAYAESAVAARALLEQSGAPAVVNLLEAIGQGLRFDEAFLRYIQVPFADFQASLAAGGGR
jgi:tetratricopeptide (TPR) repeat protein